MSYQNYRKVKKITNALSRKNPAQQAAIHEEEEKANPAQNNKRVTFASGDVESSGKQRKHEGSSNKKNKQLQNLNNKLNDDEEDYEDADDFDDVVDDEDVKNPEANNPDYDSDEWLDDDEQVNGLMERFGNMQVSDMPVVTNDDLKRKNREVDDQIKPFLGTEKDLDKDEVLEFDNEAYDLFHRSTTEWPCLSFDLLLPGQGLLEPYNPQKKKEIDYPLSVYCVAGTQAEKNSQNAIYFMKWYKLHKTRFDDDSGVYDEEDIENDEESAVKLLSIKHASPVNRIRSMNGTGVVALWDERGRVSVYNGIEHLKALAVFEEQVAEYDENGEEIKVNTNTAPLEEPKDPNNKGFLVSEFKHQSEGYGLQWNPHIPGLLASGSGDGSIYFYQPADETGSKFIIDDSPFQASDGSIEDIQFCPDNKHIFAACSTDGCVYFFDTREDNRNKPLGGIQASNVDINVITWNQNDHKLFATGDDAGAIQIWDVRNMQKNKKNRSIQNMKWHKEAITSIEFQPYEESVLTASCADNRITIWDFSVEADKKLKVDGIPDQLMFIHQGFQDAKEIQHHPENPDFVLATAHSGFHIFKPNYEEADQEMTEY